MNGLPYMRQGYVKAHEESTPSAQGTYLTNAPSKAQYEDATSRDYSKYDKYLNVMPSITGEYDHNEILAQAQNGWDMTGNALVQTGATLVGEVVTMAGGIVALGEMAYKGTKSLITDKEFNFAETLDNPLLNAGIEFQNLVRDEFKILQTKEAQDGLAFTDASWWATNAPSIASAAASIVVPFGVTKLVTGLGSKLISGATKLASTGVQNAAMKGASKVLETTARGLGKSLTSGKFQKALYTGIGAHSDIFIEVAHGFNEKIEEYKLEGASDADARERAGEWAADSYRDGAIAGLAFNLLEANLILGKGARWAKHDASINTTLSQYVKQRASGSLDDIANSAAIRSTAKAIGSPGLLERKAVQHIGNMLNEGVEEMRVDFIMQNADHGVRVDNAMPLIDGDMDWASRLGNFLTKGKNYDSFVFGALGAGVTKLFTDRGSEVNHKSQTAEYVQRSLNSVQDIDNILTTQFKEGYKPLDDSNPNGLRVKDNELTAPIHSIAQSMLFSAVEMGQGSYRYLDMLAGLSDAEMGTYFGIEALDIPTARSFVTETVNELKSVNAIKEIVQKEYKGKDTPNKEAKIFAETAIRYSNDYYGRQLAKVDESISGSLAVDAFYAKYMDLAKLLSSAQANTGKKMIGYRRAMQDLNDRIERASRDVNTVKLNIPSSADIAAIDTRIAELHEEIASAISVDNTDALNRSTDRVVELKGIIESSNNSPEIIADAMAEMETIRAQRAELLTSGQTGNAVRAQAQKAIEDLIKIKANITSNADLYEHYARIEAINKEEVDSRTALLSDQFTVEFLHLTNALSAIEQQNRDENGKLSDDYTVAKESADSFMKAYNEASSLNKAVKAEINNTIDKNNISLRSIQDGTYDEELDNARPIVNEIVGINSVKKLTKQLANINSVKAIKEFEKKVKEGSYYRAADDKERKAIDKEIDHKEAEIVEIEESRIINVKDGLSVKYDASGKIESVTSNYTVSKTANGKTPLSFSVGDTIIMPDSSSFEIAGFDLEAGNVTVITADGTLIPFERLVKLEVVATVKQAESLLNTLATMEGNPSPELVTEILDTVANINTLVTTLSVALNPDHIETLQSLAELVHLVGQLEGVNGTESTYNRLTKLIDTIVAKDTLTAYNARFDALFGVDKVGVLYDRIFKTILNSEHTVDDVFNTVDGVVYMTDVINKLGLEFTKEEVNMIETINNENAKPVEEVVEPAVVEKLIAKKEAKKEVIEAVVEPIVVKERVVKDTPVINEVVVESTPIVKSATLPQDLSTFGLADRITDTLYAGMLDRSIDMTNGNDLATRLTSVKFNSYTEETVEYMIDVIDSPEFASIKADMSILIDILIAEIEAKAKENLNEVGAVELDKKIELAVTSIANNPVNATTDTTNNFVQSGVNALTTIIRNVESDGDFDKITSFSLIKYYIGLGYSKEDAIKAYSNISILIDSLDTIKKNSLSDGKSVNVLYNNMRDDIEYVTSRVSKALSIKTETEVGREFDAVQNEDFKFGHNGIRIELPLFRHLDEYDGVDSLKTKVSVRTANAKGQIGNEMVSIEDIFAIQNTLSAKTAEVFVKAYGISGYETFVKHGGLYISLEKVAYANDNLVAETPNGLRTVYNSRSFNKAVNLLTHNSHVVVGGISYSPAGELRLLTNSLDKIAKSNEAAKHLAIDDAKTLLNALHKQHLLRKTDFVWQHLLESVLELDTSSEKEGAGTPTMDVEYDTYLENPVFVNRLVDVLKPIYKSNRNNKDAKYVKYSDDQVFTDRDVDVLETRVRRAHNNFVAQYSHRRNLRKYADIKLKPIGIISVNNPSLNYIDPSESHSLMDGANLYKGSNAIPYIRLANVNAEVLTVTKSNNVDGANIPRLQNMLELDRDAGRDIRPTYLIIRHPNGNTSYAPTYNGRVGDIDRVSNNPTHGSKIDKYVRFVMTSLFKEMSVLSKSAINDPSTRNIRLSNGLIVSKNDILNDLSHIFTTKSSDDGVTYFDFTVIGNELQLEYIQDGRSHVTSITFNGNKPTHVAHGLKNTGYAKEQLSEDVTIDDLYDSLFNDPTGANIMEGLIRSTPFSSTNNKFEFVKTYRTIYDQTAYENMDRSLKNRFAPVYELFETNIEYVTVYENAFDYIVQTGALVTNIAPIINEEGDTISYNSPTPQYEMSMVANIPTNDMAKPVDAIDILATTYSKNLYKGIRSMISNSKEFTNSYNQLDYTYVRDGVALDASEDVVGLLEKLPTVGFNTIDDSGDPAIMKYVKTGGKATIVFNKAKGNNITPASFKNYLSHEIVHHVLTEARLKKSFEGNKASIRNVYMSLFKELVNPNTKNTDAHTISNLLQYIFGTPLYNEIVRSKEGISDEISIAVNKALFESEKWQEIVTYAYTDMQYAELFNRLVYNNVNVAMDAQSGKGLFNQIKKFFNTLLDIMGIDVNDNSYLRAIQIITLNSFSTPPVNIGRNDGSQEDHLPRQTALPVGMGNQQENVDSVPTSEARINDNDFDLFVVDLDDTGLYSPTPTRERAWRYKSDPSATSINSFVSLGIEQDVKDLYVKTKLNNNLKIC